MPKKKKRNSSLEYDSVTLRYRSATGLLVARQVIRRETLKLAGTIIQRLVALSNKLREGEITVAEWLTDFRADVKTAHSLAYVLAKGGRDSMTQSDWGTVGQITRFQYDRLNRFAEQIQNGGPVNMGRVRQYGQAPRITYENTVTAQVLERNPDQKARWVRTANESCDGCIEQEDRGVQRLDDFPDLGTLQCLTNCRCFIHQVN